MLFLILPSAALFHEFSLRSARCASSVYKKRPLNYFRGPDQKQSCKSFNKHPLLPSRLYCRLRNFTESASCISRMFAGCTAGREFHPTLKLFVISIFIFFTISLHKSRCNYLFMTRHGYFQVVRLINSGRDFEYMIFCPV